MFEEIIASVPERQRPDVKDAAARKKIAEQIAQLITMAQEGRARKLDQTTKVKMQFNQVIAQAVYLEFAAAKPDAAAIKAYYDAHKDQWEEAKARHILIRFTGSRVPVRPDHKDLSEADALVKANEVRAKIAAGADFGVVAKAESDDTGSGANGGDLGAPFKRGSMVPEFDNAAFTLPVGELSQPIRSQFGFHLIQVQSRTIKPLDGLQDEIEQKMKPEMAEQGIEALKKKTVVTYDESYFGAKEPVVPPAKKP
jgi:parvulin-like peptidyl-prolyl isomerase